MDTRRSDGLSRHFTPQRSRRSLLGLMLGGGLAIAATQALPARADHQRPLPAVAGSTAADSVCQLAILSSSLADATAAVERQDAMQVAVNGITIYAGNAGSFRPAEVVGLGSLTNGDRLAVRADHNPELGDWQLLSPLYLHCLSDGRVQTLDAIGYPWADMVTEDTQVAPNWTFYDQIFTVDMVAPTSLLPDANHEWGPH